MFSSSLKENLYLLAVTPPTLTPSSPSQPLIYFLSICVYLFWIFHINGILQYEVFCDCLSFSTVFSRFTHVVAYFNASFLIIAEYCSILWSEFRFCKGFLPLHFAVCTSILADPWDFAALDVDGTPFGPVIFQGFPNLVDSEDLERLWVGGVLL